MSGKADSMEGHLFVGILFAFVGLIVVGYVVLVFHTRRLDNDPNQQALALLLLSILDEGKKPRILPGLTRDKKTKKLVRVELDTPSPRAFFWAWQEDVPKFFDTVYPSLTLGQRKNKLVHAVSLIKSSIDGFDYALLRRFCGIYREE